MSRFPSLKYAPSETRQILRDRFARKLRVLRQDRFIDPELTVIPDMLALRLLDGMDISFAATWSVAEAAYCTAGPLATEAPDLEALAVSRRVRKVWGRVKISQDLRIAAMRAPDGKMDAFKALVQGIHARTYTFNASLDADADLAALADEISAEGQDTALLAVRTPEWVAARLWEKAHSRSMPAGTALQRWADLWGLLQHPELIPSAVWGAADAKAFQDAALGLIASEPALAGWAETRDLYVEQIALANNVPVAVVETRIPDPPRALVDRALWLESPAVEASAYASLDACGALFGLLRLLLADVDAQNNAKAPHPIAVNIIDLAVDRAEVFIALLHQVRAKPKLLADLVLHPQTSALACLIIAQWRPVGGAWERSLAEVDYQIGQSDAFMDAVGILGEHLRDGKTDAREPAAVLVWLHRRASPGFIDDVGDADLLMASLRRELASCPSVILLAMATSLQGPALNEGLGTPEFAAVLDLCQLGDLTDSIDPETLIAAYERSICDAGYRLTAHRVGSASAAALAQVSGRSPELRQRFLYPIDIRSRLAAFGPGENEFTFVDSIARSLRTHIRILCRIVIGGPRETPADVVGALVSAVRSGALEHKEKARIAAFAPRFENALAGAPRDRSLAADLAAALARLSPPDQDTLIGAILETDEPLILAQILPTTPPNLRPRVEQRIAALAPDAAAEIRSLPEMQARIDQLLTAEAADAAASYMAAELELKTLGKPQGRELERFKNQLRLAFLREDWSAIATTPDPSFTAQLEREAALETLRQFRGLAALKGPGRNPAAAKALFAELFAKRPSLAFATNWFAAAISELLESDSFGLLQGDKVRAAQQAMADLDRMTGQLPPGAPDEVLECNRAQLLLALGEPGQALAVLSAVTLVRLQAVAAAYRAIALARLGQSAEATATLDGAEYRLGRVPVLTAARAHIASGAPFLSLPAVSVHDDLIANVGSAIARFRSMSPQQQALALQPHSDAFEALLIDYVRAAADAVVSLVPMMKKVRIDDVEDDLNAFVQHLLAARVHFLNWSVADQSKGGFSANANAGERDIVLSWGSTILAVIEALKCKRPLTQDVMRADLESHFQKLLGYGNPRIFFHLTYAYIDVAGVVNFLETAAATASPLGFKYLGQEKIPHEDSRPPGFVARYEGDFGEVKVVFLILNMGQHRQRQAGQMAGETKARKAPKASKAQTPKAV